MIRILHLYPELMNLYGDYGNLSIIVNRIKKMGLKVKVERKEYQAKTFLEELKQMVTDIVTSVLNDRNPRQISVTVEPIINKKGNKKRT